MDAWIALTEKEFTQRLKASRKMLAECTKRPSGINQARISTELGILKEAIMIAPLHRQEEISRLISLYDD